MTPIKVFIADDHILFLQGMVRLIKDQSLMEVVGTAVDGREAIEKIGALQPDVALIDVSMPHMNGIEASRLTKKLSPKTKILILSMHDNGEFLRSSLEAGASGYLLKDSTADQLFTAIKEVYRGNTYLDPSLSCILIKDYLEAKKRSLPSEPVLTDRERAILQLLAEGYSNRAIADLLKISLKTVETHRKNIMKKLGLHRLSDLVRYAIKKRIIEP